MEGPPDRPEGACQECSFSFKPQSSHGAWVTSVSPGRTGTALLFPSQEDQNSNIHGHKASSTKTERLSRCLVINNTDNKDDLGEGCTPSLSGSASAPRIVFTLLGGKKPGGRRDRDTGSGRGQPGDRASHLLLATVMGWCRLEEAVPTQRTDRPRRGTHSGTSLGCSILTARERHLHRATWESARRGTCIRPCPHSRAWAASPGRELCPVVFADDVCTWREARDLGKNQDLKHS